MPWVIWWTVSENMSRHRNIKTRNHHCFVASLSIVLAYRLPTRVVISRAPERANAIENAYEKIIVLAACKAEFHAMDGG
jgi:hypothetical protein